MLGFLQIRKKGLLEREFDWLTLESIVSDLEDDHPSPRSVAAALCRLSIYGGLDLKAGLTRSKHLKYADPDRLVIEGVAYTWSHIFRVLLRTNEIDIYVDEELSSSIYTCSSALESILSKYARLNVGKEPFVAYSGKNLAEASDILAGRLLALGKISPLGNLKENLGVVTSVKIFTTTMMPGILVASKNLIRMYFDEQ